MLLNGDHGATGNRAEFTGNIPFVSELNGRLNGNIEGPKGNLMSQPTREIKEINKLVELGIDVAEGLALWVIYDFTFPLILKFNSKG